jgi:hypothetical protein
MTERPRMVDLVRSWVSKAEHDLLNIENNLAANDIPWDTVCFHANNVVRNTSNRSSSFKASTSQRFMI